MSRKLFSFTGECSLERNGVEVQLKNNKTKNKTFRLMTSQKEEEQLLNTHCTLSILLGNTEEILYCFKLDRLSRVFPASIAEGKLTLQVLDEVEPSTRRINIPSDISLKNAIKVQKLLSIMIRGVSTEILKSFCGMLSKIKFNKNSSNQTTSQNSQNTSQQDQPNPTKNSSTTHTKIEQKGQVKMLSADQENSRSNSMSRLLRKQAPSQETEKAKFKVNKSILEELQKEQANAKLKRKHTDLANIDPALRDAEKDLKKLKLGANLFQHLPESVLKYILKFVSRKEYPSQKLICKDFYKLISSLRTVLDFRAKGDLPPSIVVKHLNSSPCLQRLYMGPSKHLTQTHFLEEIHLELPRLKLIDFTWFTTLTDKMVAKVYRKCKAVQVLKFGYYSGVTDTVVETLPSFLENVKELYFKSPNKSQTEKKDKLTDTCFAKFITRYEKLETFSLYICGSIFFNRAFDNPLPNLTVLKFEQILLGKRTDLSLLSSLEKCTNLQFLKIGNIRIGQTDLTDLSVEESAIFGALFIHLYRLKTLKLGQFTSNYLLFEIAANVPNLIKLVLGSDCLDDTGLIRIMKNADLLAHLDISRCGRVNGHCLEDIRSSNFNKLVVSFDEHRCRCVHEIFLTKGILGQVTLVNIVKKRR